MLSGVLETDIETITEEVLKEGRKAQLAETFIVVALVIGKGPVLLALGIIASFTVPLNDLISHYAILLRGR